MRTETKTKKRTDIKKLSKTPGHCMKDIQMFNKHMTKYSTSIVIRVIKVKTVRFQDTLARLGRKNAKTDNTKCW